MKILKSRVFKCLLILFSIGLLLGIISFFIMSKSDKELISNNLIEYINNINNGNITYLKGITTSIISSIKELSIIWASGIIFIFIIIIPLYVIFKGIIASFTICNIINTFNIKGLLYSVIMALPALINILILLVLSYFSIQFSIKCYKTIKHNKFINLKSFIKNYALIYLLLIFASLINNLIDIYAITNILRFMI